MKKTHYTNVSKEFIEYYRTRYHEIFEIPAKVEWGKDIKLLNSLQKTYNDLSIYNCGKLALLLKNSDKEVIDPIIDGYKLAHFNHTGNKLIESLIGKEEIFG